MSYELKKMSRPTTRNNQQISDEDGESESDESDTELLKDSRKKQSAVKISGKEETSSLSEDAIQRKMAFWRKTAEDEYKSARQTELRKLTGTHTTICIDVSDSMKQNNAWEQTRTFVTDYLFGMRREYANGNTYHNIALVTFGHATKIQHRLTNDLEALERIMENITLGGPSPLLAGLILSKASVTVSNFRFAKVCNMWEPPKIIVVTDGKATDVHQLKELYDQEHHKSAQEVIIDEIRSMKDLDIDIDFVYVGNPDIVFLHHLRGIIGGELMPHTSGRFLAKYFAIKCTIEWGKNSVIWMEQEKRYIANQPGGHHVDNKAKGPLDDNKTEGQLVDNKADGLRVLIPKEGVSSEDTIQRDMTYWRKTAADVFKSARQTELKTLDGTYTTICIDVSDSMSRNEAWEQTKTFFTDYMSEMRAEFAVERSVHNTALVMFGHSTQIHSHLTTDLKALECIMENITPGGPSPLLAGLLLAKASVTVSNYRVADMSDIQVPPRIIVVTDGKATDVDEGNELFDQDQNESAHKVKQLIIDEIRSMKEEEDIDIDFVYVGNPDIVFLHELRGISGGELKPHTSGRIFARYKTIRRMLKEDEKAMEDQLKQKKRKIFFSPSGLEELESDPHWLVKSITGNLQNPKWTKTKDSENIVANERKTDLSEEIDDLFQYESEETVLSVFNDLIYMVPNVNELYMEMSDCTLLTRAVDKNFLSVAEQFMYYGVSPLTCDPSKKTPLYIAIDNGYDEMAALIVSKLPNFIVRRLFGDSKSKPGPLERGSMKQNLKKKREKKKYICTEWCDTYDDKHTVEPEFKLKDLISKCLDKTLLQVLDSFIEEQKNGSYKVHVKLLYIDDKGREPKNEDLDTDDKGREPKNEDLNIDDKGREPKKEDQGTHDKEGEPNYNAFEFNDYTTFQKLAETQRKDLLNHPVIRVYMEHEWKQWCQTRLLCAFFVYLLSLFCLTYSAGAGVTAPDVLTYDTPNQYSRVVMEVISYTSGLAYLYTEIRQMLRHKRRYFEQFSNYIELLSAILIILLLPLRYAHLRAHWYVFALCYFLWVIRIFKYAVVFRQTGVYAEVIKRILAEDFLQFSILFIVINAMFSGTFLLVLKADDSLNTHNDTSSLDRIFYLGGKTLIGATSIVDYTGLDGYKYFRSLNITA